MNEFVTPILTQVADVLQTLIITVIGAAGVWLVTYIKRKFKIETTNSAIEEMHKFVTIIVGDQEQTLVNEMKKLSPDGKLTDTQQEELLSNAIEKVLALMSQESVDILRESSICVEDLIKSSIESKINSMKSSTNKTTETRNSTSSENTEEVVIADSEDSEIIDYTTAKSI